jgi:hypothetical protein
MARDQGIAYRRQVALQNVKVRPADSASQYAQEYVTRDTLRPGYVFDRKHRGGSVKNGSIHEKELLRSRPEVSLS